jgi:hypothetical protein
MKNFKIRDLSLDEQEAYWTTLCMNPLGQTCPVCGKGFDGYQGKKVYKDDSVIYHKECAPVKEASKKTAGGK